MRLDQSTRISINIADIEAVELCEPLGRGGFGHVWKVRPVAPEKTWFGGRRRKEASLANTADYYVLKYINAQDQSHAERVRREAAVKIKSRHVIRCLGCAELSRHEFALLFPYEQGCNLAEWMAAHPQAAWRDTRQMFLDILDGVRALHQAEIIHRDLKPQNILITQHYDEPRIIDFGLAKFRGMESVTFSGERFGSPGYTAPEIVFGYHDSKAAGERYDVYALGVILYELAVGEHPRFRMNANGHQSLRGKKHLLDTVECPFDEDPRVLEAIRRSTMFEPEDRLRSVDDLIAILNGQPRRTNEALDLSNLTVIDDETPPTPRPSQEGNAGNSPRPTAAPKRADQTAPAKSAAPQQPTPIPSQEGKMQQKPPQAPRIIVTPPASPLPVGPGVGSTWTEPTTGMIFMYIPAGRFMMGSPDSEKGRDSDESPVHEVRFAQGFWMGKYPVTGAEWQKIMENNPSHFKGEWRPVAQVIWNDALIKGERRPVEQVTWNGAQKFLQKLNATPPPSPPQQGGAFSPSPSERGQGVRWVFRLPSEAEWEYACRAGTTTPFSFGETISTDQANYDGTYTYGKGKKGVYRGQTTDVGSFSPNAWGLCDMHGNVWEWCADTYHENYEGAPSDGSILGDLGDRKAKVLRGGGWSNRPDNLRSADRGRNDPGHQDHLIGFRVVVAAR